MRTFVLCLTSLTIGACTSTPRSSDGSKPAAAGMTAMKPVGDTLPAPAKRPVPSAAAAASIHKNLAALGECVSELGCDAFDALVESGETAGPDTLAFVSDLSRGNTRRLAARVLGKIQYAPAGAKLVALGNTETDVMIQIDLFKAAGQCGGDETFDALAREYDHEAPGQAGEHLVALRDGLKAFHARALPWALEAMTRGGKDALKYADVMCDVAKPADRDTIVALVGTTKNYLVEDRLAAKALSLGATDAKLFDTLQAGLESEDAGDRDDAAMMLRSVARRLPSDRKAKAVELMQRALAKSDAKDPDKTVTLKASLAKLGD